MNRTIRQHFVPRAYLRRFSSSSSGTGIERTHALIKRNTKIVEIPIQNIASRELFYDFGPGDQEQVLEQHFSQNIEGDLADLLRESVDHFKAAQTLVASHKRRLAAHLALQYLRTHEFRRVLAENLGGVAEMLTRQFRSLHNDLPDEFKVEANVDARAHLDLGMNDANIGTIAHILTQHAWQVVRAPAGRTFLTSDAPVMLIGEPLAPWMGVGFATYGARVLFPLDAEYLVVTTDIVSFRENGHLGENVVVEATEGMMDQYNFIILGMAAEQAVARTRLELERAEALLRAEAQYLGQSQP
ncbi:DUF4238 domain-containing protein [Deinococcus sp. SDU3-2]|uniref:DUF4238 domain-containing protein n=1 Tax=Deinococcus terrestris TaxID=2651870 RepID=A0A7X1TT13_9DEIO|nr:MULTISPECIES: DUF4238 domain-containing protein [Deinococcus]MPY68413.1 DUF4238 domain-containing protein [Deinococcus terrestris]